MSPGCFWVIISEALVAGVITVDLKLAVLKRQMGVLTPGIPPLTSASIIDHL